MWYTNYVKPTLHVVGLPHTNLTEDYNWCAFTSLNRVFINMMADQGYRVVAYWGQNSDVRKGVTVIPCHKRTKTAFRVPEWAPDGPDFGPFNQRVIPQLKKRLEPGDIILSSQGQAHLPVIEKFRGDYLVVEHLTGYFGICASVVCYPSYAWRNVCMQGHGQTNNMNSHHYDAVIPHFIEPKKFKPRFQPGQYLAWMGRMNWDKGYTLALDIADRTGIPLKLAGPLLKGQEKPDFRGHEYVGVLNSKERRGFFAHAIATLAPSLFIEPFNMVHVESMACGTPAITTDFGAFAETNFHWARCRNMKEFVQAVELSQNQGMREQVHNHAMGRFTTDVTSLQYDQWLQRAVSLTTEGWYGKLED